MLTGIMAEYICERNDIMETDNILIPRCFEREFVQKGAFLKSALFWAGYIENATLERDIFCTLTSKIQF